MADDPDQCQRGEIPDVRADIAASRAAHRKDRSRELLLSTWALNHPDLPFSFRERAAELEQQDEEGRKRGAGRKAKKRAEIIQCLRAEIEARHVTLDQLRENPGKWAKVYGYHHEAFAAAVAALLKERNGLS